MQSIQRVIAVSVFLLGTLPLPVLASNPAMHASKNHQQTRANIHLNTGSLSELSHLKGIGPRRAAAIIQFRKKHGAFKRVDDLVKVPGIGAHAVALNRHQLQL